MFGRRLSPFWFRVLLFGALYSQIWDSRFRFVKAQGEVVARAFIQGSLCMFRQAADLTQSA